MLLRSMVNFVSLFCELPEEFYCYMAELSTISSIALATKETKISCFVVIILVISGERFVVSYK